MSTDPAIPAAKVEACAEAIRETRHNGGRVCFSEGYSRAMAIAALRAAAAYDAAARLAAGPQPTRERDTDAWWAD